MFAALSLAACSSAGGNNARLYSSSGTSVNVGSAPPSSPNGEAQPEQLEEVALLPELGQGSFTATGITPGESSGSAAGDKLADLRDELSALQAALNLHNQALQKSRQDASRHARQFEQERDLITAAVQEGSVAGDPDLTARWGLAQENLRQLGTTGARLTELLVNSGATYAKVSFLLDRAHLAGNGDGTLAQDLEQQGLLESDAEATLASLERFNEELSSDRMVVENLLTAGRGTLGALQIAIAQGDYLGASLYDLAHGKSLEPPVGGAAAYVGERLPLGVIRFATSDVEYERPLLAAVRAALEKRPVAGFDLVAVNPAATSGLPEAAQARKHGEEVLRFLSTMGLPENRLTLSATSSDEAQVNEVHFYIR